MYNVDKEAFPTDISGRLLCIDKFRIYSLYIINCTL